MLGGYNTLLVLTVATLLGMSGGLLGVFVALRGRTLVSDAIAHSTLAGIAIGFLIASSPAYLMVGALVAGMLAAKTAFMIPAKTKLSGDAAVAFSLVLFFSIAVVVLSIIQSLPYSGQAGLGRFLIGNAAAVGLGDGLWSIAIALVVVAVVVLYFKELSALCFDEEFAKVTITTRWDNLLIFTATLFVVGAVQIVGVVFSVALLVMPYAATHLWVQNLKRLCLGACVVGGISGAGGTLISLRADHLPTGTMVVLCAAAIFVLAAMLKGFRIYTARTDGKGRQTNVVSYH